LLAKPLEHFFGQFGHSMLLLVGEPDDRSGTDDRDLGTSAWQVVKIRALCSWLDLMPPLRPGFRDPIAANLISLTKGCAACR
jgi:hypothetical protein